MITKVEDLFLQHIVNFYRYNSYARKKYLDAIEKLPWEEVVKDRGASFQSIRNVFLHILNAYRFWFQFGITDNMKNYHRLDPDSYKNIDDLRRCEREVDSMVMSVLESLQEKDLSRVCVIHSDDETRYETRHETMESILIHMIEEELQHRGEINCMLWQQDIDPPIVGYHAWSKGGA